ncbi:hypothetical protein ACP6PL_15925 [Dapis sp. BLCC M126]|uniref:hypothetical protein n=1 Tax=Dapis sp. BLCC M126 TaxID=3400189 RepID=UPI003CF361F4
MSDTTLPSPTPTPPQKLGINIAGFVKGELGIGEGVRATLRSIETTNILFIVMSAQVFTRPSSKCNKRKGVQKIMCKYASTHCYIINKIISTPHRNSNITYQNFTQENPHLINLFQVNTNEVKTFLKKTSVKQYFTNKYNIGFWAW